MCVQVGDLKGPLLDQVRTVRSARAVVAAHGASGALLALAMRPSAVFLELQSHGWDRRWAVDIALLNGIDARILREVAPANKPIPPIGSPGWIIPMSEYQNNLARDVSIDPMRIIDELRRSSAFN